MKLATISLLVSVFALSVITVLGQSASGFTEAEKQIQEGTYALNGQQVNSFMFGYEGNLGNFLAMVSDSLGKPTTLSENSMIRTVEFQQVLKPSWADKKITLRVVATSKENKHVLVVTCLDSKKKDLLAKNSESLPKVRDFIQIILDRK
jgi:hypothetical protein